MSFLAPFYLLLAIAGGVPLLLHLMRRNSGARADFPAARYLQRAEREHSRSLRLRNLLLMLLRLLLVLALALAAARPYLRGGGEGHGPTAMAVVLDNSLSTTAVIDGRPVFNDLRDAAADLIRATTSADRLWLVTADGNVRGGSRAQLLDELRRLRPLEGAGDLALAVRRASAAAQSVALPAQMVALATDGQQTTWQHATASSVPVALLVPAGKSPSNHAVLDVTAAPPRWTPRGVIMARVSAPDSASYQLLIGERTLARGSAASGEPIAIHASPAERGWQGGRLELQPDDFHADDVRYFALWIGAPPSVSAGASSGAFVSSALAALAADGRVTAGQGIAVASADELTALPALVLPPADPLRLGAANRALARLGIPWRYGIVKRGASAVRGDRLTGVTVTERYGLALARAGTTDTLATAGGEPWLVAGAGYVLVGSRLEPAATTLPVRAEFVPWLAEMLGERLGGPAGDAGAPLSSLPNAPVTLPEGVDALEELSGARRTITDPRVNAPAERGVWFMLRRGRRVGALVVNAPIAESDLARWPATSLAHKLGGAATRHTSSAAGFVRAALAAGARRAALVPLLLLALLLLIVETAVVRTARSSRSTAA